MMRRTFLTLLSLAFLLPLIPFTPGAVALQNYTEDYETDTVGQAPTAAFVTITTDVGSAGSFFTTTTPALGTQSLRVDTTTQLTTRWDHFTPAGVNLCSAGSMQFSIRFAALPSTGDVRITLTNAAGGAIGSQLRFLSDGSVTLSTTPVAAAASIAVNTWYNATYGVSCNDPANEFTTSVYIPELNKGATLLASHANAAEGYRFVFSQSAATASYTYNIDNYRLTNVNDPPPTAVGSSATAAVTDLVGFDVDPTGSGLIARTNAGDFIRSYAPKTLTQLGSRDTNCNDPDMVATSDRANVYVVCDSGTNNPAFFSIRAFDDSVYDFPGNCDPADDCLDDIPIDGSPCSGFDDDQVLGQIEDLVHIPLDYSYITQDEALVDDARAIAIAYSTTNGFIGVWEFTTKTGFDACNEERIAFAGTAAEQICVWQPDPEDDLTLIGAVDSGGATKIYEYRPALDADTLDGSLGLRTTLSPTGGVAISCAEDKALIVTNAASSNVHLIDIDDGTEVSGFPITVSGEADRGAVLTGNANFFFVVDSTTMKLGYANNATIFGALTLPSGTFKGAGATFGGQDSWIATTTTIAYYDTFTAFPTEIGSGCAPSCDEDPTIGADGPLFEDAGANIAGALGITTFGGNLFMGSITIALVAVGMGGAPLTQRGGSFSLVLCIVGSILGFLIAWGFGFFTDAVVFSLVVLCIIGLGVKFWIGRGSSG